MLWLPSRVLFPCLWSSPQTGLIDECFYLTETGWDHFLEACVTSLYIHASVNAKRANQFCVSVSVCKRYSTLSLTWTWPPPWAKLQASAGREELPVKLTERSSPSLPASLAVFKWVVIFLTSQWPQKPRAYRCQTEHDLHGPRCCIGEHFCLYIRAKRDDQKWYLTCNFS